MTESGSSRGGTGWGDAGVGPRGRIAIALCAVLFVLGVASLLRNSNLHTPDDGAAWTDFGGNVVLVDVVPGGAAERAGLRVGDVLLSIGGEPVASSISAESRLWSVPVGGAVWEVLRDGDPRQVRLTPDDRPLTRPPLANYLAIVGFFFLVTGALVSLRLPGTRLAVPHGLLSVGLFCVLALSDTPKADGLDWVLFWLDRAGRILVPSAFLHFVFAFVRRDGARIPRWRTAALYLPAALLGASALLLVALGRAASAENPAAAIDLQNRVELGWMTAAFLTGVATLAAAYLRHSSRAVHRQLRWMLWGTAFGILPIALLYMLPTALGLQPAIWAPATALPMILIPLALSSALLRYRLADLELFIKRGVATISVVFFTLAAYELIWTLFGELLPERFDPDGFAAAGLAALATALLFSQLRVFTLSLVDRLFYRGKYNFRRTLMTFGRELNSELDLDALLSKIERRVADTMDFDRIGIWLADPVTGDLVRRGARAAEAARLAGGPEWRDRLRGLSWIAVEDLPAGSDATAALHAAGLTTLFPLRVKGTLRALLAVGARHTGDPLNSEDVEMLVTLCAQAASAIEAARLLDELGDKVSEIESLRRANENILESSRIAILVIDEEGTVLNLNRASEDLTGVPRAEARGRSIGDVYALPLVRGIEQLLARARRGGEDGEPLRVFRSAISDRSGRRLRVNLSIAPLEGPPLDTDRSGAARRHGGWVITLDDVTDQVRMEETLMRQDRLAAIGLLASGVAHEVNTPLTGISSYAQMLLEETDPSDPRYELLRKIERQTARASTIATGLLNFSRGTGEEHKDALDLAEMIDEALTLIEPQLRGTEIRIERALVPGLPPLQGHRGKLQQVVLNLLLNARDALDGRGTIRVALHALRDRVRIEVTDDGCGIAEEDQRRIFDPFFTTKQPGKGTGLGLALSWNIVKEHGGEIGVESRVGEGTTFTVDLPLTRQVSARG